MDPIIRRQQQQRSNSISGQEFHSNGNYHQLKHSLYTHHSPYVDHERAKHSYYGGGQSAAANRLHYVVNGSYPQHQQLHQFIGRSISPNEQMSQFDPPQRDGSIKYPIENRHLPRNHLHASLECLNSTYTDQEQQSLQQHLQYLRQNQLHHNQQQQQQQHQQQQQQHHQQQQQYHLLPNQHYATSYVLSTPPANTIINPNGDQDLAAAAMGNCPPQQQKYQPMLANNSNGQQSGYSSQGLLNRTIAQVSQSPLRRIGLGSTGGSGGTSNLLSQLTGGNHTPIRAGHSSLSLASSSYPIEDKLQSEIKKLQSELKTEKEKNEALNSQLNINSGLMAAFEQSLTTLNTRLRQLTALNDQKDKELDELKQKLAANNTTTNNTVDCSEKSTSPILEFNNNNNHTNNNSNYNSHLMDFNGKNVIDESDHTYEGDIDKHYSEQNLIKIIEDLRRQLIEKDRLLTDTRLEALSAAHQLEQLESRLNGEHSLLANENDIDEGVMMMANHSPSDSDAITDSAHFSEMNSQISKSNNQHRRHHQDNHNHHHHRLNQNHDNQRNNNGSSHNEGNDMMLFAQTNSLINNDNDICNINPGGHLDCGTNTDSAHSNKSTISTDDANEQISQNTNDNNDHHHHLHQQDDQSHNSNEYLMPDDGRSQKYQPDFEDISPSGGGANLNLET